MNVTNKKNTVTLMLFIIFILFFHSVCLAEGTASSVHGADAASERTEKTMLAKVLLFLHDGGTWRLVVPAVTMGIIILTYVYLRNQTITASIEEEEEFYG